MNDTANLPEAPTTDQLLALSDSQAALLAEQAEKLESLQAELAHLKAAAPKASAKPSAVGTFKVGKQEYTVVHGLHVRKNGLLVKLTPADIIADKEFREDLVRQKSSAVKAV